MKSTISTLIAIVAAVLFTLASFTSFSQASKFSVSLNSLATNFNYSKSNNTLHPYKKNYEGLQASFSYQAHLHLASSMMLNYYTTVVLLSNS